MTGGVIDLTADEEGSTPTAPPAPMDDGGSLLPALHRQNAARPCYFARLPDDCVSHLIPLIDAETVPCFRATCRAFRAAARARADEKISPKSMIRSGPSVANWAWEQPAFRAVARYGSALLCAELGNHTLLERVLAHRNDNRRFDRDLWMRAGGAGHAHVLHWLLGRAASLSPGNATRLDLSDCKMGAKGVPHLASALRTDTTLVSMDLRCCFFSDRGATQLASALAANTKLTSLNVLNNALAEAGAHALVALAESKPNQIKSLCGIAADATVANFSCGDNLDPHRLDPADAVLLAFELRINATVTSLDLGGHNGIGAVGAQHIAEALKVNATVTELDLRGNEIGAVGAQHVAPPFYPDWRGRRAAHRGGPQGQRDGHRAGPPRRQQYRRGRRAAHHGGPQRPRGQRDGPNYYMTQH
ncbi:hypothetical protein T492DRAFT_906705, partial [Pavlovales sp. CCMP2436]